MSVAADVSARVPEAPGPARPTLGALLSGRRNSFGLLRLAFAAGVVLVHTVPLGGFRGGHNVTVPGSHVDFGIICVYGFFVLSGVLITGSAERTGTVRYFWHRILRIFPGFWVNLLGVAFVVAPIAYILGSRGSLGEFLHADHSPFRYVGSDLLLRMRQYDVSGTPAGVPYPDAWAGSLYTLVYEFRCYIVLGALGAFGILRRRRAARWTLLAWAAAMWLCVIAVHIGLYSFHGIPYLEGRDARSFFFFFAAGAAMYVWRWKIPQSAILMVVASVATVASLLISELAWDVVGVLGFAYAVLWLGLHLPHALTRVNAGRGSSPDISYGIYTWGFPVQQILSSIGANHVGWGPYTAASLAGATVVGSLSWYLVERPALRLKNWTPGGRRRGRSDVRGGPPRDEDTTVLTVLQSFPMPRPTTNPYLVLLARHLDASPGVRCEFFTWRGALLGRYDVLHLHWPEILVSGGSRPKQAARQLLVLALLARLRMTRTPVVRTMHNMASHESRTRPQRILLALVDRQTSLWIVLNSSTRTPGNAPAELIPHGHYREWFGSCPRSVPRVGRMAHIGLVRRYKGLEELIDAFTAIDRDAGPFSLNVAGSPSPAALAQEITDSVGTDDRIGLTLRFLTDEELVTEVTAAELVVLPHRNMHNSGSVLAALSMDRPVLVEENAINRALAAEVGAGWVHTFRAPLGAADLTQTMAAVHRGRPGLEPNLAERGWPEAADRHRSAYRRAIEIHRVGRGRPGSA